MPPKKIQFQSANNETLSGLLDLPTHTTAHNFAIFAHCFTCNKNLSAIRHISNALTSQGFGVLRFDFTGLGESEGQFETTTFTSNISDLIKAADYLTENHQAPTLLIGHSLGGAAVLASAAQIQSIKAVATIGAPYAPEHVSHLFKDATEKLEKNGKAEVNIGGRPFCIGKQFVDDLSAQQPEQTIKNLKRAVMIMHSPQDTIVEIDNAAAIYQAAKHPKSFISLNGADHLLSKPADASYAGSTIAAWAKRYIETPEQSNLTTDQQMIARLDTSQGYKTDIQTGPHTLTADEPATVGGTNLGPSPYGYLLAALGACTAMTLKMYAARNKWDLQIVDVHLSHDKIYAKDCDCDLEGDNRGRLDKINRQIEVQGDLTSEQKDKLIVIADRCPVHKTLESEVLITTTVIEQ